MLNASSAARFARVAAAGSLVGALFGCGGLFEPKPVDCTEGTARMLVPPSWKPLELNDIACLEMGHAQNETYLMVVSEDAADFTQNLGEYSDFTRAAQLAALVGGAEVGPKATTLGGRPAIEYVITGRSDGVDVTMIHTVVDGQWSRFQVAAWTLTEHWARREEQLRETMASFQETPPPPAPPLASGPWQVLRSPDGSLQISVPAGWSVVTDLSDNALLQAKRDEPNGFLTVLAEPNLEGLALDAYQKAAQDDLLSDWDEPSATTPAPLDIGGLEALTTEVRGTTNGVRLVGQYTVVRGKDRLYRVFAWTLPSGWKRQQGSLVQLAPGLKELN